MTAPRIEKALLMAAGLGTRLRPITDLRIKALLPVFGIPVAQFCVDSLVAAGVRTVVINTHHLAAETQVELRQLEWYDAELRISDETKCLLGSGGGIRKATSALGSGPFFLANADVISNVNWLALALRHDEHKKAFGAVMTLAVFPAAPLGGAYREIQMDPAKKKVMSLGSLKSGSPFFIGAAVLEPEALTGLPAEGPAEFVSGILDPAIRAGKAGVFYTEGIWYDIGSAQLWRDTHFALMNQLEIGYFPDLFCQMWRRRIELGNERIADRFWLARGSKPSRLFSWEPPCYWNPLDVSSGEDLTAGFQLGPNSVLYGLPSQSGELKQGIGYAGIWIGL